MNNRKQLIYQTKFQTEKLAGALRYVTVTVRRVEADTYFALVSVCQCGAPGSTTCACPALMREYDLPDYTVDEVAEHIVNDIDDEDIVAGLLVATKQGFARQDTESVPQVNMRPARA